MRRRHLQLADFSLYAGYARMMAVAPDILGGFANVARWGQAMAARPAIQRATR